jgi:hypothetical protein
MKVVPTFKVIEGWEKLPAGYVHKDVDGVAVDSKDNVYLMTRKDARIMVYDRDKSSRTRLALPKVAPSLESQVSKLVNREIRKHAEN